MAKLSNDDIIASIKEKTIAEVAELVKAMEEEFGVSAAPVAVAGAVVAGGGEAAEEQSEFDVILAGLADDKKKIAVIKEVRAATGLGLKEAKEKVEEAGAVLKEGVSKEDAAALKEKLEAAGAKIEIK